VAAMALAASARKVVTVIVVLMKFVDVVLGEAARCVYGPEQHGKGCLYTPW
jgi:hypothetical protein